MLMTYIFPKPQFKSIASTVGYALFFVAIVLGSILYLHFSHDISLYEMTSDFATVMKAPVYTALLSQIGIFFWAGTLAICLISATLLSGKSEFRNVSSFFYGSAVISLILGLDDVFLFHELVFPSFGISQKIVYFSYAFAMLVYGLRYVKFILKTEYVLLVLAIGGFGLSICIDVILYEHSEYISNLLEDGFKFIGLIFWFSYYFRVSKQCLQSLIQNDRT